MKKILFSALATLVVALQVSAESLYEQAIARAIQREFSKEEVSYLLLDARTQRVIAARWDDLTRPVPFGSLVKPFTALAYGETHGFRFPDYFCKGREDGCWWPRGHGRVNISQAIGQSCNAYFRALAVGMNPEDVLASMRRYGIQGPRGEISIHALVGFGSQWRAAPIEIARAYCEIASRYSEPGVLEMIRGMAASAQTGTGRAVETALPGISLLAKTGTAPCIHRRGRPGDGFAMVLFPAESPALALLVRVEGVPGAQAAEVVGRMLAVILRTH